MNIADERLLKTRSVLFMGVPDVLISVRAGDYHAEKGYFVFTDYQHTAYPCHVDEHHLR